jgi:hypothetical protein
MKLLPIGISTFSEIIENNYVYVDKTKEIHDMVTTGKIYFLSRPRRFGKSLLISTLESLFKGEEKLFKNLYIYDKWNWEDKYPVIHLDMSKINSETVSDLKTTLKELIDSIAIKNNITLKNTKYNTKFYELIEEIYNNTNKKVVVLIDEYDAPFIDNLKNDKLVDDIKDVMNNFYKIIKSNDEYLRFIFLTGVSKFSKVSVFSGINSPDDISLNKDFATICGYTQKELESYFKEYINILAIKYDSSINESLDDIRTCYNGYSWDGEISLYNPYSTLKLFRQNTFSNYWFSTGTSTLLINTIKNRSLNSNNIESLLGC